MGSGVCKVFEFGLLSFNLPVELDLFDRVSGRTFVAEDDQALTPIQSKEASFPSKLNDRRRVLNTG